MDIDKISTYLKTLKDLKAAKTKIHVAESSIISLVVAEYGEEVLSAIHSIAEYDKVLTAYENPTKSKEIG